MLEKTVSYDGDVVRSVHFKKGRERRPLWQALQQLDLDNMIGWADRFDSLCPLAAEWCLAMALEESADVQVPERIQYVRTLHGEINRLIWFTTYLGKICQVLRLFSLREEILLLREQIFLITEELLGGRVLPHAFKLGGCHRVLSIGESQKVRSFLKGWRFQWDRWVDFFSDPMIESRLSGLLKINPAVVEHRGWWGVVGKASGVAYDARQQRPYGAYPFFDFKIPSLQTGDAWARVQIACQEIELSLQLIDKVSSQMPSDGGVLPASEKNPPMLKDGIFKATSEASKGAFTAAVVIKDQKILNMRIFSSGQRVWPYLETLLVGIRSDDLDLAIASLGVDPEEAETL